MVDTKACNGAETRPCRMSDMGHGQECRSCGMRVRDDLIQHSFFGFAAGCNRGNAISEYTSQEQR
ncbi:Uncharacterised protein [Burkholderia pseudomallei]|nr:Uncharacterised protein [Burkholderia pseudomallei]